MSDNIVYITDERRKRDFAKRYEDYFMEDTTNNVISVSSVWNFLDYLRENLNNVYKEIYPLINECYNLSLLLMKEYDDFEEDLLLGLGGYYLTIENLIKIRDIVFQLDYDNFAILINMNFVPNKIATIWNYYYYAEKADRSKSFDERFIDYFLNNSIISISDMLLVEISSNKNKLLLTYNNDKGEELKQKAVNKGKDFIDECKDFIYF